MRVTPTVGSVALLVGAALTCAIASPREDIAQAAIRHFIRGELSEAMSVVDARVLPADAAASAQAIYQVLKATGSSPTISQVFWSTFRSLKQDLQRDQLVYHVVGAEAAALVFVTAETANGKTLLTGFRCEPAPRNLRERYPLIARGLPLVNYLFLLVWMAVGVTILSALVLWCRRRPQRRWLWLVAILLGVGKIGLYWLPGPFSWSYVRVQAISVSFLGVGAVKFPLYDPWLLTISIPAGALAFLALSRRRESPSGGAAAEQADAADEAQGGTRTAS
jgi:hypothetical protein